MSYDAVSTTRVRPSLDETPPGRGYMAYNGYPSDRDPTAPRGPDAVRSIIILFAKSPRPVRDPCWARCRYYPPLERRRRRRRRIPPGSDRPSFRPLPAAVARPPDDKRFFGILKGSLTPPRVNRLSVRPSDITFNDPVIIICEPPRPQRRRPAPCPP